MKSPAFILIGRSLCLLCAALSCTPLGPRRGRLDSVPSPGAAGGSCAFFTRHQDIAHLWIFPIGGGPPVQIEIGLRPSSSGPHEYAVYYESGLGFEGYIPRWQRTDSVYARVFWADTVVTADSGSLTLEVNSRDRLSGRYSLSGLAGARLHTPGRRVQFQGAFDATRDTAYERFVYRPSNEVGKAGPQHRCAIVPPT